jgi:NAD kinase
MPMAVAWFSVDSHESIKTMQGELSEICKTEGKANVMALDKAKNWVDQQSIG